MKRARAGAADIDGSGVVDVTDLIAVISSWGSCPDCPADTNGDQVVDVSDLASVGSGLQ